MIDITEVENIHDILIEKFGGLKGIRDKGALESAINRAHQSFGGQDLYPEPTDKAAAIFESIISNHPFVDGNKRTAYVLLRLTLLEHRADLNATKEDKYDFVIRAAKGEIKLKEMKNWIEAHLVK